jgi:hypothetical protein
MDTRTVPLRVVRAKIIESDGPESLEGALNDWLRQGGQRTFLNAFQVASFGIMVLYAEG